MTLILFVHRFADCSDIHGALHGVCSSERKKVRRRRNEREKKNQTEKALNKERVMKAINDAINTTNIPTYFSMWLAFWSAWVYVCVCFWFAFENQFRIQAEYLV